MNDILEKLEVGSTVRVKLANCYEYGTVTSILNEEVSIQLSKEPFLTRQVAFAHFVALNYEVINTR